MHSRIAAGVAAIAIAALAGVCSSTGAHAATHLTSTAPCAGSAAPATYQHVILIMEENHSYSQVIGPEPYQTSLAKACGVAADYTGITYPSLPNYIALTSGAIPSSIAGKDCLPSGTCVSSSPSIFSQVASWKVFAESMPSNCSKQNSSNGLYVPRHTGAPYYTTLKNCSTNDVPLGTASSGAFVSALSSGSLPAFSLVAPNTTDDAHGGCESCADNWLKTWIPKIIASPAYQNGSTAIFITYDSDNKSAANHVATLVIAPSVVPGTCSKLAFTHYSLLRTEEDILGITTHLGAAATAAPMEGAFNL
jgi:phospholipase C